MATACLHPHQVIVTISQSICKLFLTCVKAGSMKPEDLAMKIIIESSGGHGDDKEEEDDAKGFDDLPSMKQAQQVLSRQR
jgi:hypothetical protein